MVVETFRCGQDNNELIKIRSTVTCRYTLENVAMRVKHTIKKYTYLT